MALVQTVKTTCNQLELCTAIIKSWFEMFEVYPSAASCGIIIAQWSIETGVGKNCFCWNLGNIKWSRANPDVDYCALEGVWEMVNGVRVEIPPTNSGAWFRAFPTLDDGTFFYLNLMKNSRYSSAWEKIEAGDVVGFATILKNRGYFTASLADYIRGMNAFYNPFIKDKTYDHAMANLTFTAPSLQPWVEIPVVDAPVGILTVLPSDEQPTPAEQGIDEAGQVPQQAIEDKAGSLATKLVGYLGTIFQWLPRHK